MHFSAELRDGVASGEITLTYRLWQRPQAKVGGRHWVGPVQIEIDDVELRAVRHGHRRRRPPLR